MQGFMTRCCEDERQIRLAFWPPHFYPEPLWRILSFLFCDLLSVDTLRASPRVRSLIWVNLVLLIDKDDDSLHEVEIDYAIEHKHRIVFEELELLVP